MQNKNKILLIVVFLIFLIFASYNISAYAVQMKYNGTTGSDQQLQEIKELVAINGQKEVIIEKIEKLQEQLGFEHSICFQEN